MCIWSQWMCYNGDRKYKELQRNEKVSGAPYSWWARKQFAAFSTTKETVVNCKFAVATEMVASPINTSKAATEETGWTRRCLSVLYYLGKFLPVLL